MARLTFKEIFDFIKMLRIDVFLLLWALSFSIPSMVSSKLIQDKYCISDLEQDPDVCLNLEKLGPEYETLKNKVLKFSAKMGLYSTYITTIPQIFCAFLLGYWLDRHPGHFRYLMAIPTIAQIPSSMITLYNTLNFKTATINLLWAHVPNMFSGGISTMIIGCYTYVGRRTRAEYRSARFGLLQIFIFLPMSLAMPWGAQLFYQKPMFGLYRNYIGVQMYTLFASLASGLWAVTMLYDAGDPPEDELESQNEETQKPREFPMEEKQDETQQNGGDETKMKDQTSAGHQENSDHFKPSSSMLQSAKEMVTGMVTVFTKPRPNNKRTVLAIMMISSIILNIDSVGETSVDLQFVQKVYHWDIREYSTVSSLMRVLGSVAMGVLPGIVVNKLHVDEMHLIIGACVSTMLAVNLKGGFLEPWAYWASGIIMIPSGFSRIGLQSVLSRVIQPDELARIFTFLGLTDSFGPTIASTLYTNIFNATIAEAPWFYHFATCLMVMASFLGFLWLDFTKHSWDPVVVRRESRAASIQNNIPTNNNLSVKYKAGRRSSSKGHVTPVSIIINGDME